MIRSIALFCGALALATSGQATLYTSKAGGTTFSVASSWASGSSGGSVPGVGDQISCAGPLTFDVSATFGTSGAAGTFDFTPTSACAPVINPGVALTVNGGLEVHAMGLTSLTPSLVIGNGASLTCSVAHAYTISPDGLGSLVMVQALGMQGAGTAIIGCSGDADTYGTVGGGLVATWLTLTSDHWYAAMNPAYAVTWNVKHSTMTVNAGWRYSSGGLNVVIDEFNSYPATGSLFISSGSAYSGGGSCVVSGDSFDSYFGPSLETSGPLYGISGGMNGCTISGNAMLAGAAIYGDGTGLLSGNVIIQSAASSTVTTSLLVFCSSFTGNLILAGLSYQLHKHSPDFCGAAVTATGNQTWSINGNVWDGISVNPTNLPNDGFIAPNFTKTSGTATFLVSGNIVLRRPDGGASSALLDIRQWEGGYAHVIDHNTINCGFQGEGCITAELEGSTTTWYQDGGSITNNIFWTSSSVTGGYLFNTALLGYVSLVNPMAPAGLNHNATWNLGGINSVCTGVGPSYALPCTNQGGGYSGDWSVAMGTNTSSAQPGDVWNTNPSLVNISSNYAQFASYAGVVASATWASESSGHTFAVGDLISDNNASNLDGTAIIFRCIQSHFKSTANSEPGNTWEGSSSNWPVWANYWELASSQVMRANVPAGNTISDASTGCNACSYPAAAVAFIRKGNTPQNAAMHADAGGSWIGAVNATPSAPASAGGAVKIGGNASAQ